MHGVLTKRRRCVIRIGDKSAEADHRMAANSSSSLSEPCQWQYQQVRPRTVRRQSHGRHTTTQGRTLSLRSNALMQLFTAIHRAHKVSPTSVGDSGSHTHYWRVASPYPLMIKFTIDSRSLTLMEPLALVSAQASAWARRVGGGGRHGGACVSHARMGARKHPLTARTQ